MSVLECGLDLLVGGCGFIDAVGDFCKNISSCNEVCSLCEEVWVGIVSVHVVHSHTVNCFGVEWGRRDYYFAWSSCPLLLLLFVTASCPTN